MSGHARSSTPRRTARASVRSRRRLRPRGLPSAVLLGTVLAALAAPSAASAQGCTGPCPFDRLVLPVTVPAADQTPAAGKPADGAGASERRTTASAPRWTVSVEAIGLGRKSSVDQALVSRVPGSVPFVSLNPLVLDTATYPGAEALNSKEFRAFSVGPKISVIFHGETGTGAEFTYFNLFNQRAAKAVGPDSPADWLVMKSPGSFWQTQDFANQAMTWATTTELYSAELNGRLDLSGRVTVLAGLRWFQLNDTLQGDLSPADVTAPTWKSTCWWCDISGITPGAQQAGHYPPFWNAVTRNNLYGIQVGVDARLLEFGRFALEGLVKAGVFDNNAEQRSEVSMQKLLYPSKSVTNHAAFASELALRLKYQATDRLAVKVGYRALWFAGVALAAGQVQETFTTPSSVTALGVNCGSHAFFQGATAGLQYSF